MSNQDQQPPWGRRNKPQTPEELVAQLIKKLQDFFSESKKPAPDENGGNSPETPINPFANIGKILTILLVLIVLQGIYLSFFKISPGEVGVVLRLGQYLRTTDSGLHFKIPYVDHLYKVDTENIRKEEFGFRSRLPGQQGAVGSAY